VLAKSMKAKACRYIYWWNFIYGKAKM
jgi:hypothetical protein